MLSCASPEAKPTLNVRLPVTYLIPAFTTSASISFPDSTPVPTTLPSAKPTATVKSPVTALKPTWKPPVSFDGVVLVFDPSISE